LEKVLKLFVYGTLRRGHYNHPFINRPGVEFLGEDKIAALHCTVMNTLPGIKEGDGEVEGEIYECPNMVVSALDVFEGHPTMYERRPVTTVSGEEVYAYYPNARFINEEEDTRPYPSTTI